MVELLLVREVAVLLASAIGAYRDYKTGFINDWITIPLIIFGVALNLFELEWGALLLGGVVFVLGYILYYTGKVGGGDVKLFTGIALVLPFFGGAVFIISAALLAAMTAVVFFGAFFAVKYYRRGIDLQYNADGIRRAGILLALMLVYFIVLLNSKIVSPNYVIALGVPMLFGLLFVALERGIRKEFFVKKIKISEMEDDEIIAIDFMDEAQRKKISAAKKWVFGEKEKKKLEADGVHEIMVYRDLPRFGPFIFIGVALALLVPGISQILTGGF